MVTLLEVRGRGAVAEMFNLCLGPVCIYMHMYMCVHECVYMCMYICMYIYTCVSVYMYAYTISGLQ